MSTEQINARDHIFQIDVSTVWTDIAGVKTFSKKSANESDTDMTNFASGGVYEGQMMQRGAAMDLGGNQYRDPDSGQLDDGQAAVEALAAEVGDDSLGDFRFRHVSEAEWTTWTGYVSMSDIGGGNNDKASWGFTLTRSGVPGTAAVS